MEQTRGPLFVVVLNWNLPDDTIACVRSLLADGFLPAQILVVDNGSTDGSLEQMRAALAPAPLFLRSEANLGFAAGNNLGIRAALEQGAGWVWLLNNDTLCPRGTRAELEQAIARNPGVALFSPLIVYYDEPGRIWALGDRSIAGTLLTRGLHRNRTIPPDLPPLLHVDFLTACALLVRADVFQRIGLLDPSFFMYAEDADFCERARAAGFALACWTPARIVHKVSRSTGPRHPDARRWRAEYQARFYRKHGRGAPQVVHFAVSLARTALIGARDLAAGRRAAARAAWQGFRSGWFGPASPSHADPASAPKPHTVRIPQWKP